MKVSTYKNYTIEYDPAYKKFSLIDDAGNTLGMSSSQDDLESKADKLFKQSLNLPFPVVYLKYHGLKKGRITSIDMVHGTCYFVPDDKASGYSKEKISLTYDRIYPSSPGNLQVLENIQAIEIEASRINNNRADEEAKLTPRLTPHHFLVDSTS